jgi:hypothetical protein
MATCQIRAKRAPPAQSDLGSMASARALNRAQSSVSLSFERDEALQCVDRHFRLRLRADHPEGAGGDEEGREPQIGARP